MENHNKVTVLICSCDNYEDLWIPFFTLFKRYWENCECRLILNTESKKFSFEGLEIETFDFGNSNQKYGQRMLNHLDKITTPYTLLLLDDFFLRTKVNENLLDKIVEWLEENEKIACFNFDAISDKYNTESEYGNFLKRPKYGEYKLNMQAGIWRTSILKSMWKSDDTPWSWELYGNFRTFDDKYYYYTLGNIKVSPINYAYNPDGMGVFRGKWVETDVVPLFKKEMIVVDFNKRGFYSPCDNKTNILDSIKETIINYPFKYFLLWFYVNITHVISRFLKKEYRYNSFTEILNKKHK